jgi:small subunit ribosomal protein S4e
VTRRLKRRAAPRTWRVPRKGTKWIKRPAPGPHAQDESVPLLLVLRDELKLARSAREARILVRQGSVSVDGKVVRDLSRGLGLMDTISLAAPLDRHYRILKDRSGRLTLVSIPADDARVKLGRVRQKNTVDGGRIQVTLHDGRNLLMPQAATWRVGDSLKLRVPEQTVVGHIALGPGRLAYVSGGSHVGELARVDRIEVRNSPQPNRVHFKEGFATIKPYVFVVGDTTPQVALPEGTTA